MDKKYDISHLIKNDNAADENEKSTYWRSFRELYNDPEFIKLSKQEFNEEVTKDFELKGLSSFSRRKFLALLSASAAVAAAGCTGYRGRGEIIPYNKKPEEIIPGIANYYASVCTGCEQACRILVKTREGRPIKIDGNPDHPVNQGKICPRGQASIMNLYDPSRIQDPVINAGGNFSVTTWENIDSTIIDEFKNANGAGKEIAIITHSVNSPTQKFLFDEFIKAYPTTRIYSYEFISDTNRQNAYLKSYGTQPQPVVSLDKADIIVSFESDFLGAEGNFVENTRSFAKRRDAANGNKEFNRLYVVEGSFTLTGMNADHRIRIRPDAIEELILAIINEIGKGSSAPGLSVASGFTLDNIISTYNLNGKAVRSLVKDLSSARGKAVALAGSKLPESAHIAVNMLNEIIGSSGLNEQGSAQHQILPLSTQQDIEALINNLNAGKVGVVIHFGSNPVFHFANDFGYKEALSKAALVVSMSELYNETSDYSKFILPVNHDLESWGDFKTRNNFVSLQQPVISPIFRTRQKEAILLSWLKGGYNDKIYYDFLMQNWEKDVFAASGSALSFRQFWNTSLHDGILKLTGQSSQASTIGQTETQPAGTTGSLSDAFTNSAGKSKAGSDLCLVLNPSLFIGDGRFSNNGWLQEMPHPLSKIVWDNYAAVSPATAAEFGLVNNDLINIETEGRKITLPVFVQAGLADKTIETQLGYGRRRTGAIGVNVGHDVSPIMSKSAGISSRMYNVKISKAGGTYELVSTQEHYPMDKPILKDIHKRREIIVERTLDEYKNDPNTVKDELHEDTLFSISTEHHYKGMKWGMAIDLNKCTGCNACNVACYVENNIPVVGKEQVKMSREMSWIRIDRYYSGTPEEPVVSFMPMPCQHCDNAPCENVCPVVATNHSPDGLNQMVYNRCVGTRYCSNNCPYKVRRFNFYDFRDEVSKGYYNQDLVGLAYNPEVTVRSRGVMEKCTFCIQRIMEERQHAIEQGREVNGDNVKTACQTACPADAIVFGDITKKDSKIAAYRTHELGYHVIEEINVRPNVTYIAKLRNINPEST